MVEQEVAHAPAQRQVGAGEDGEADNVRIRCLRCLCDRFRRLPQPGIGDLEACIEQGLHHDLGADIVAIEPGLGQQHLDLARAHPASSLAMISLRISLVPPPISVKRMSRRWRWTAYSML